MALDLRPRERGLNVVLTEELQKRQGAHWKTESIAGDTDWLIVLPGPRYGHLELKRRDEKPKQHQLDRIAELRAMGAYAGWTNSRAGVVAFLDGLAQQTPQRAPVVTL